MGDLGAKDHTLPHIDPSSNAGKKLVTIVHDRLKLILGADYSDVSLAQYVVVMLSHKTNRTAVQNALVEFLDEDNAARFTHWLYSNVGFFVGRPSIHDAAASSPSRHARERARSQDRRHRSRSPPRHREAPQGGSNWQNESTYARGYETLKPWERPAEMDLEAERMAREAAAAPPPVEGSNLKFEFEDDEDEQEVPPLREHSIGPITVPGKAYVQNQSINEELEAVQPLYDVNDALQIQVTVPGKFVNIHPGAVFDRKVVVKGVAMDSHRQGGDMTDAAGVSASPAARSVLVKGIPISAKIAAVKAHFAQCGYIVRISLLREPGTGNRSELAWVEFNTFQAVQTALELDGSFFQGQMLTVFLKESPEARAEVDALNTMNNQPVAWGAPMPWGGGGGGGGGGRGWRGRGRGGRGSAAPRNYKWQRQSQTEGDSTMNEAGY